MSEFLLYTIKVSICTGLFYLVYFFILRNLTFFRWNRGFLLISLTVSILIPLINIRLGPKTKTGISNFISSLQVYYHENVGARPSSKETSGMNLSWTLDLIYVSGVLLTFLGLVLSVLIIINAYRKKAFQKIGSIRIVKGQGKINNCSFLDTIFADPVSMSPDAFSQVIKHESCHILLKHTHDKLFVRFVQVLLWYNPFIYLYKKSLEEIHEFEADDLLVKNADKGKYAQFLLNFATGNNISLVHYFSKRPLKTRIKMLFALRSDKSKKLSYLACLPILAFTFLSFSKVDFQFRQPPDISFNSDREHVFGNSESSVYNSHKNNKKVMPPGSGEEIFETKVDEEMFPPDSKQLVNKPLQNSRGKEATGNPAFFSRITKISSKGIEYDEIRLDFGNSHLVGTVRKGGKILYIINGIEFKEEEITNFTQERINQLGCPCKISIINTNKEPLIDGEYEGKIELLEL